MRDSALYRFFSVALTAVLPGLAFSAAADPLAGCPKCAAAALVRTDPGLITVRELDAGHSNTRYENARGERQIRPYRSAGVKKQWPYGEGGALRQCCGNLGIGA